MRNIFAWLKSGDDIWSSLAISLLGVVLAVSPYLVVGLFVVISNLGGDEGGELAAWSGVAVFVSCVTIPIGGVVALTGLFYAFGNTEADG